MIDANHDKMCERNTKIVERMLEASLTKRTSGSGGMGVYCRRKEHDKCMYGMCWCDCHEND